MSELLGALGALEKFGIAGLVVAVFAGIIWKLFSMLTETIEAFRNDVKESNKSRTKDAEQVSKAVDQLTNIVLSINRGGK